MWCERESKHRSSQGVWKTRDLEDPGIQLGILSTTILSTYFFKPLFNVTLIEASDSFKLEKTPLLGVRRDEVSNEYNLLYTQMCVYRDKHIIISYIYMYLHVYVYININKHSYTCDDVIWYHLKK